MTMLTLPTDDEGRILIDCYGRLSKNPDGVLEKIDRQLKDSRGQIDRARSDDAPRGFAVNAELSDNNLSAWRKGVKRPDWNTLIHRLETGLTGGVSIWNIDRLVRRCSDLEILLSLREELGIFLIDTGGVMHEKDEFALRVLVAHAQQSSKDTSRRLKRKFEGMREDGVRITGGPRPFGFPGADALAEADEDGKRPPVSAAQLRRERKALIAAYDKVLDGGTMRGICVSWNEAGLLTAGGRSWTPITVRQVLARGRNAGLIQQGRYGPILGVAKGEGEPLIDPERWHEVNAMVMSNRRGRPLGERHLASGLVHCAECGVTLVSRPSNGRPTYSCVKDRRGCGQVRITGEGLDEWLRELVVVRMSTPAIAARISASLSQQNERAAAVQQALDIALASRSRLFARYGAGEVSDSDFETFTEALSPRIAKMQAELAEVQACAGDRVAVEVRAREAVAHDWSGADTEGRRRMLADALRTAKVVVGRSTLRGREAVSEAAIAARIEVVER